MSKLGSIQNWHAAWVLHAAVMGTLWQKVARSERSLVDNHEARVSEGKAFLVELQPIQVWHGVQLAIDAPSR